MNTQEKINFCKKRIDEQNSYLEKLLDRFNEIDMLRYTELKNSAIKVKYRFEEILSALEIIQQHNLKDDIEF